MEKHKISCISLKKPNISNKNSIISNYSTNAYYILPMIDKNIINSAYQESSSAISKYINTQAKSFYRESQSFKMPKSKDSNNLNIINKLSEKNINKLLLQSTTKTESNEMANKNNMKINFYLTAKDEKTPSSDLKINNTNEDYQNQNIYLTETNTLNFKNKNKKIESSISIDRILNKNQFQVLNSTFHRLRTYQPTIDKNWKFNNGISVGMNKINNLIPNDVDYQSKLFNDQYKLIVENYQYYKMKLVANNDFINSFKALNLKNKIEFNKSLEEICGLLILLPRLILVEFYKYVEYLKSPSRSSLKEKYIFDEVNCLFQNNKLIYEIFEFFQNSFEIYLTLVKEVDGMALKQKDFENALSVFEKIRFNLNYICNMAENFLINYTNEMGMIFKLNRFDSKQNKINNIVFASKIKNYKIQSKNKERQRKLRIDECLVDYNNVVKNKKNNNSKRSKKFKSIVDSKMISKLLGHCRKEVKYNIISERINNEFDWNINENWKIKNKPIKINY